MAANLTARGDWGLEKREVGREREEGGEGGARKISVPLTHPTYGAQ